MENAENSKNLNSDVIGIILQYSEDIPAFLNKKWRDEYFKKNGIWIHIRHFKASKKFKLPQSFRDYSININFDHESVSDKDFKTEFSELLGFPDDNTMEHIYQNTILVKNSKIHVLEYFPNLKYVIRVENQLSIEVLEFLEKTGIQGCTLLINSTHLTFLSDITERINRINCNIRVMQKIDHRLILGIKDKITYCYDEDIIDDICYPNLEHVYEITNANIRSQDKFPKLRRCIWGCGIDPDILRTKYPMLDYINDYYGLYQEHIYRGVIMNNFKINYYLASQEINRICEFGKKYGTDNIKMVLFINNWEPETYIKLLGLFRLSLYFEYDRDLELFLEKILAGPKYDNLIVRIHSDTLHAFENKIKLIYLKKGIYLDDKRKLIPRFSNFSGFSESFGLNILRYKY